jgi:phenylpropionate dioxygenase-like ring-hydroxylating dioxygenase large terminal subunit
MPLGYPTKQSLFDQDYAVVLTPDRKVMAYIDRCPHRSAALSQGRLTSNSKYLQCAYHGWSFDAEGKCVEIPQNIPAAATDGTSKSSPSYSPRACATAISATLHQGMVWLWPALDHPPTSLPPTVPELDDPDFRTVRLVRDFPVIDWSILLSNIMDPDHGMFAHQLPSFDLYSGSPEFPMKVSEEFPSQQGGGVGWMMTCRVPAADKLMQRKKKQQQESSTKSKHSSQQQQRQLRTSTTTYMAPAVVTMGRRDDQNRTSFLSGFWVSPTGAGKSRFLTATAARNVPFSVPRWFQHVFLNAFLDQDSVLVASQQPHTLLAEAERYEGQTSVAGGARQSTYVYQSPSDRMVRLIDAFFDATLSRSPNRVARLREMKASGALRTYPPREVVLDLESQHLRICQDSRDAVRNCKMIIGASTLLTLGWLALKVSGRMAGLPKPFRSAAWPALATLAGWSANFFRRRFYYGYTIDKLRRDLAKIPSKTWADP